MPVMTVVLERSDTLVGKAGRVFTRYPYTHIALSFDMEHFYSFSRRNHYDPFDSGFTIEKPSYYACLDDVQMKAYHLEISREKMEEILAFNETVKDLPFDIYGMLYMPFGIYRRKTSAYNCMTYIARVLEITGIPLVNEPYYRNNIKDLEQALINSGHTHEFITFRHETDEEYMKKRSLKQKAASFINIHRKLLRPDK